jgi:hypothetical protein
MKEVGGGNASKIECWNGWNLIKYYYAVPEVLIPVESLRLERHQYWKSMNYLYRPDQMYLIDTKSPGNRTQLDVSLDQMQRAEKFWSIKAGSKPVADFTSITKRVQDKKTVSEGAEVPKLAEKERKKYEGDLKKAEDTIQALQRQLEKLKQQQKDDTSKKSKAHKSVVADSAEVAKLRAILLDLKKENSSLKAEVVAATSSKRAPSPEPEPRNSSKRGFTSTVSRSSRTDEGDEELEYQEKRRKAARVSLEASQIEQQNIQVESAKVIERNKQEQLQLLTVQRTHLLADKMLERSDEDRRFQKQLALQELEYKQQRDQNRDIMRMVSTANDPVNLAQMLRHKRSLNAETMKSPVLTQHLELLNQSSCRQPSHGYDVKKKSHNKHHHHTLSPSMIISSSSSSVPNSLSNDVEVAELNAESIASMDVAALTRAIERENAKASNYRSQLVDDADESDSSSGDDEEEEDA